MKRKISKLLLILIIFSTFFLFSFPTYLWAESSTTISALSTEYSWTFSAPGGSIISHVTVFNNYGGSNDQWGDTLAGGVRFAGLGTNTAVITLEDDDLDDDGVKDFWLISITFFYNDGPITILAIAGVTVPVTGATPVSTIADTTEYTATIAWSGSPATFAASTVYTATITITPKTGYTLTGVTANSFTVFGAAATNTVDSGVVTATFPATAAAPISITAIGPISGTPQVGVLLTAGALTPSGATASYQWQIADTSGGTYTDISGATSSTYTPVVGDVGKFIRVAATGTGSYTGSALSAATTVVLATGAAPATVLLKTTSNFAILAGETITNIGATTISGSSPEGGGDVGLYAGSSVTGFGPGANAVTMTGWTLYLSDSGGVASTAKTDLVDVYNDAAGRTPTTTFTGNDSLTGKKLTTGVYSFASGTTDLSGTLTLDAQGDPNAVFIFQATSTLITGSGSKVELINGARYCRVFWVVPSSATLGTNSTFVGHIFAHTSIAAQTGATVQGQLLAQTGSVTLDHNTIINGPCVTPTAATTATTTTATTTTATTTTETTIVETATAETETTIAAPATTTITGGQIPKTSTPWYNILLIGAALTLIGVVGWLITRKKIHV